MKIMSRGLVSKWLKEKIENEYTITVHPTYEDFPERLVREIKDLGWRINFDRGKMIISSKDPISLAKVALYLKRKGYFISD
jgi:hypothetical protein